MEILFGMCAEYVCWRCRNHMITDDSLIPSGVIRLPEPFNSQKMAQWTNQ